MLAAPPSLLHHPIWNGDVNIFQVLPPRRVMLANLLDDCREALHVHVSFGITGGMRRAVVANDDGILHNLIRANEIRLHNSTTWTLCSCLCVSVRERGERKERVRHADDGDG